MSVSSPESPRWEQRYAAYRKAFERLAALAAEAEHRPLQDVEEEALVSRFGVTWELAWKLLRDLLVFDGVRLDSVTPRAVVRAARASMLIADDGPWLDALDARNAVAHTYDEYGFRRIVGEIRTTYRGIFAELYALATARAAE